MTLCCHGLVPSAAHTKVQYARQCTKHTYDTLLSMVLVINECYKMCNILFIESFTIFTCVCVSYAEARLSYTNSVCLSVCLSVARWYCIKTAEHIVMLSSPHDNPFILVLCISRSSRNSDGVTPCGGSNYRWGIKFA